MTVPAPLIGTQLGPYQVEALLGSGGMATVYRGIDSNLQRPVAIKVLSTALAGDPDYVRRFKREAQLIASLQHPNVAQVYAFGEQDGAPYMVQELLPGPTLEQRLLDLAAAGTLLPRADVLAILSQLAAALDAAHRLGVIHRDVKPANAIANAHGELVLTDFGIARSATDTHQTQAGIVMGTPAYVAPEQAISSVALTPAVDVYALGVLLFQLLTGKLPFVADTPTAVVLKHLYEAPPSPSQLRPDVPPGLDAAVVQALAKEPEQRYQSAGELAAAVARAWPEVAQPVAAALVHSQPTTAWTPPNAPTPPPIGTPAATPVHEAATRVWQLGTATRAQPAVTTPPVAMAASPVAAPVAVPPADRSRLLLWLGLALLAVLILGGIVAWRSGSERVATAPTTSTTAPTAAATLAPTTAPTTAPTEAAPIAPAPTVAAVPVTDGSLATLETLLNAGIADGRAGDDTNDLLNRYGELQSAMSEGNTNKAEEQLREFSKNLDERSREGKMDAGFADEVQTQLAAVATEYDLKQP